MIDHLLELTIDGIPDPFRTPQLGDIYRFPDGVLGTVVDRESGVVMVLFEDGEIDSGPAFHLRLECVYQGVSQ